MKLLLVNPNTTQAVTDAVLDAARAVARPGTELQAVTAPSGPRVIGSRTENALAQHGVLTLVAEHLAGVDAVVLAVSLDTGLWACRELLDVPVVGMTEAGLLMACTAGTRIGVVTYGARMGPLYRELVASYGLGARLAGIATIDAPPERTFSDAAAVEAQVLDAALQLIARDGAEAVLLAGAAMASMASRLQPQVAVPLIDGVACAVAMAESRVALSWPKARVGSLSTPTGRVVSGVSDALGALFDRAP
jgi:allantoin racemase